LNVKRESIIYLRMRDFKAGTFVWLLAILFAGQIARGWTLYSYDMDSLVYVSTDVVEATLGESHKIGSADVVDAKITAVYKGNLRTGQTIPLATLEFYEKPGSGPYYESIPLSTRDTVFLFLEKATSGIMEPNGVVIPDIPANSGIYQPEPSGIELVRSGHVIGFFQFDNPGPYAAGGFGPIAPEQWPTERGFRDSLVRSVKNMDVLATKFETMVSPTDVSWLMSSLRTRPLHQQDDLLEKSRGLDEIARMDCDRLAQIHDTDALAEALALDLRLKWVGPGSRSAIFGRGFGTRDGLKFLCQAIADEHRPLEERRRCAEIIASAAEFNYLSDPAQISGQWAADFVSNVASLAYAERSHVELSKALVDSAGALLSDGSDNEQLRQELDYARASNGGSPFPCRWKQGDYSGAFAALRNLHDATDSESLKYEVELAIGAADPSEYKLLGSLCGPIVSIVRMRENPEGYQKPPGRNLVLSSRWAVVEDVQVDRCTLVAEHEATGKRYTIDHLLTPKWKSERGCEQIVTVPEDAPKGLYRICYQFKHGDAVISTSHYLEAEL